jgi:nitrous oxidase accessory protein
VVSPVLALLQIVVAPGGPVPTVTAALAMARAGDTVVVTAGVYREPRIIVTVPVAILGQGEAVLDGGGAHEVLTVRADDVTVRGLTIRNVGASFTEDRAGIRLDGVRRCVIADNHLVNTFFGIYAARASDCVVSGNRIEGRGTQQTASGNAIHLFYSEVHRRTGSTGTATGSTLFARRASILDNESRGNLRYGCTPCTG